MRKLKLHKNSVLFGLLIGFILMLCERFYHAFHNFINGHFNSLGQHMASCRLCVNGKYTESGTNVDTSTTVGWVKEGMTADDFLKEKEKQGNSGKTTTKTTTINSSSDARIVALRTFITYWSESGEKVIRGYWSQFRADWIENSNIFQNMVTGFNQAFYTYFGSTQGTTTSQRFNEFIKYFRDTDGFLKAVAQMHLVVHGIEDQLITTKNDFKKAGINPDTSILYLDRKLWKSSKDSNTSWLDSMLDVSSNFRKMKDEFAEWCKPLALALNTNIYAKLKCSLF